MGFDFPLRYIDNILSFNNIEFDRHTYMIFPSEPEIIDTTDTTCFALYINIHFKFDNLKKLTTKIHGKYDESNFPIVIFSFVTSYIPSSPVDGVFEPNSNCKIC